MSANPPFSTLWLVYLSLFFLLEMLSFGVCMIGFVFITKVSMAFYAWLCACKVFD